jgi:hypothetical protein
MKIEAIKRHKEYNTSKFQDYIVEYFANCITSEKLCKMISPNLSVEKENDITDILKHAQLDWEKIEVDPEGPNKLQNKKLDIHIEDTIEKIIETLKKNE